jgi:hypothetical protein
MTLSWVRFVGLVAFSFLASVVLGLMAFNFLETYSSSTLPSDVVAVLMGLLLFSLFITLGILAAISEVH